MTKLTVPVMVRSVEQAAASAAQAASGGADLVEYRLDRFEQGPAALRQLVDRSPLPCIVTCRPQWEGGAYRGDESARIQLLADGCAGNTKPAYLDVELAAYHGSTETRDRVNKAVATPGRAGPGTTKLILSSHDFVGRPRDLGQRIEAMQAAPACAVVKVAWRADSIRDNLEAFAVLGRAAKPTIALCMGEHGLPSRVLAKKYGALLTFVSLDDEQATAPGQPTLADAKRLYHWDRLNPDTRVYGIVGYPVGHSMSPLVHNAAFELAGVNAVYLPLPIAPGYEPFAEALDAWLEADLDPAVGFAGASVTIPHKENLLRWARRHRGRIDRLAERIGAANTLRVLQDGQVSVHNTDADAAVGAVRDAMAAEPTDLRGKRVAVIGAGGAARAVAAAFADRGATVVVYNRTIEKAQTLAAEINQSNQGRDSAGKVVAARLEKLCDSCCQIYINCTPLGMHPDTDSTPIPSDRPTPAWGPDTVVFDTVYNPPRTRLLRDAHEAGCRTISGVEMFVRQAAAQFKIWQPEAYQPAIPDLIRRIVHERLGADR